MGHHHDHNEKQSSHCDRDDDHHGHHDDHHHDHNERTASQSLAGRAQRQGGDDVDVSFGAVAAAGPGSDGKKCIDKVEMVEETEYDDVVQCDHSYDKRCHTTYVTNTKCSKWPKEVCSVSKKNVKKYTPITG